METPRKNSEESDEAPHQAWRETSSWIDALHLKCQWLHQTQSAPQECHRCSLLWVKINVQMDTLLMVPVLKQA